MFADDIVGKDSHNEIYGKHEKSLCVSRQLTHYRPNDAPQPKIPNWGNTRLVGLPWPLCYRHVLHVDRYPMNKSYFNGVQKLQLEKSHIQIPMMLVEECLHGVGSFKVFEVHPFYLNIKLTISFKQSLFPQNIAMAASFDTDIVYRVGRAIGTEARSIGVHGCFSPVLDLAQDPRWGRVQGLLRSGLKL